MTLNKKITAVVLVSIFLLPVFAVLAGPTPPPNVNPWDAINRITDFVFGLVIVLALLFIIVAAIMFITSAGNDEQVKKAKTMLWSALIGIVVALLAKGVINWLSQTIAQQQVIN